MLLVKKSSMVLHKPVTPETYKYTSYLRAIYEIIGAVMGKREFSATDHFQEVK